MDIRVNPSLDGAALKAAILSEVASNLDKALAAMKSPVEAKTREAIVEAVKSVPEFNSILSGTLHGELGIENPEAALNDIIAALQGGVVVTISKTKIAGGNLSGGMSVSVLKSDFREVLDLASVQYESVNARGQVTHIPWLQWLLEGGPVISNFFLSAESVFDRARSKKNIMLPSGDTGKKWQLEPQNSVEDNWLTRAFAEFNLVIEKIVLDELTSRI